MQVVEALARVGTTPDEVTNLLGGLADDAAVYLVGSLAAGLGNAGSDVDVQIFVEADASQSTPMMFFIGEKIVDVQYFAFGTPQDVATELSPASATIGRGRCALGPAPPQHVAIRLSRWATAIPLEPTSPPLLGEPEYARVAPSLVRVALEEALVFASTAHVIGRAGAASALAWRRAGRAALEVVNCMADDLFVGAKWTWAKAARSGVARALIQKCATAVDEAGWREVWCDIGLDRLTPHDTVVLEPTTRTGLSIGRTRYLIAGRRRLVFDSLGFQDGAPPPLVAEVDAKTVASLVANGAARLKVDACRLDAHLEAMP